MKYILFLMLTVASLGAQETVNVYIERSGPNVIVYADNDEVIPMTVMVDLNVTGMKTTLDNNKGMVVIPAKSQKFLVAKASPGGNSREMTFQLNSETYEGDQMIPTDINHVYSLPYAKEKKVEIYQGYDGKFSHNGLNAIDFGLEIGDEVHASRSGVVYKVQEAFSKSCADESCKAYNNYVIVYHEDGTFAEYVHLNKNGVEVTVGDQVKEGDLLGYSGNTGWSSGPHLHFMLYRMDKNGNRVSFKTKFYTKEEKESIVKVKGIYSH